MVVVIYLQIIIIIIHANKISAKRERNAYKRDTPYICFSSLLFVLLATARFALLVRDAPINATFVLHRVSGNGTAIDCKRLFRKSGVGLTDAIRNVYLKIVFHKVL